MHVESLPRRFELDNIAAAGATLSGVVPLHKMPRLRDVAIAEPHQGHGRLAVVVDRSGEIVVSGWIVAHIEMQCQRCLEAVSVRLAPEFELVVVGGESQAEALARDDDPVVATDGLLDVWGLLEDELLLALPVVARHEGDELCDARHHHFGPPGEEAPTRERPFAELARLKRGKD